MKKLLLLGAFLLSSFFINAQTTLYQGTFNDAASLVGWSIYDADGDTRNWGIFTGDEETNAWGLDGDFAGSRSWQTTALTPDNYLVSPVIALPPGADVDLTFLVGVTYYSAEDGDPERMSVYVTPIVAPTLEDLEALSAVYTETYDDMFVGTATLETVDLSAYAGQAVRIVFRHHDSTNQEIVYLDTVTVTQNVMGIDKQLASQFSVFPNPANDVINVSNNNNILVNSVEIIDLKGRTVKTVAFDAVSEAQVNISDLASGMYMMNISSDKGRTTKKIVKN